MNLHKEVLGQASLLTLRFYNINIILPVFDNYVHSSVIGALYMVALPKEDYKMYYSKALFIYLAVPF